MNILIHKSNPRSWIKLGFIVTFPSVVFWLLLMYGKISDDHYYLDTLLECGGTFCGLLLKGLFPFFSLMVAILSSRVIQQQAIAQNVWHRETQLMRLNRSLVNWNAFLILVMILSFINN